MFSFCNDKTLSGAHLKGQDCFHVAQSCLRLQETEEHVQFRELHCESKSSTGNSISSLTGLLDDSVRMSATHSAPGIHACDKSLSKTNTVATV